MTHAADFFRWQDVLKKNYARLLKQKKRTLCESAFVARFEGRTPAGALRRALQERIRD